MKVMYRVWLSCDGKAIGEGPDELLQKVDTIGSLHKAAAEMRMSYRKVWLMLRAMEQRLGFLLLERKVGGVSGGGSHLTPQARDLMKRYEAFRRDVEATLGTFTPSILGEATHRCTASKFSPSPHHS
jgi:molybdate transport system regulatory protein